MKIFLLTAVLALAGCTRSTNAVDEAQYVAADMRLCGDHFGDTGMPGNYWARRYERDRKRYSDLLEQIHEIQSPVCTSVTR